MQNNFFGSKLNTVLLLILIVLMVFALRIMLKDKEIYFPNLNNSIDKDYKINTEEKNDYQSNVTSPSEVSMEAESKWASSGENEMPPGWVSWEDTIKGVSVQKKGPADFKDSSYIISGPVLILKTLGSNRCIGDTEDTMCAIGENSEVIRYFDLISYYW